MSVTTICPCENCRTLRAASGVIHLQPFVSIDRMKSTEKRPLEEYISSGFFGESKLPELESHVDTVFRDSKDANFLLIHLTDLLCGTIREHFEQYEDNLYFKGNCPSCLRVFRAKKRPTHKMCRGAKGRFYSIVRSKNLHNIIHLFPDASSPAEMVDFFMLPAKMMDQYFYLICKRI